MICQNCSIFPSYILKDIAVNSNVPQTVRDIATKTLAHTAAIHHARTSAQGKDFGPQLLFGRALLQNFNDESVKHVHDHCQKIFHFYQEVFKRDSYDGEGAKLIISVHFDGDPDPDYDNAFWFSNSDPKHSQWAFGDGDFVLMDNFTKFLDISAHEFTHAVIEYIAILPCYFQSGSLNESISDVFGSMIKQYFAPGGPQKAEDVDWLVGEGMWLVSGGRALRDMEKPGTAFDIAGITKDQQVVPGAIYVEPPLWDDNGGVHINSSISNRAFVLMAKALGGFSWEVAGQIWYASLTDPKLREVFTKNGRPIKDRGELMRRAKDTFRTLPA